MNWLKKLFSSVDRMDAASDRAAAAMEGIALTLERAEALVAQRFGFDPREQGPPALPEPAPGAGAVTEPEAGGVKRGRKKATEAA